MALVELVMEGQEANEPGALLDVIGSAEAIAKKARRHLHPLTGGGFYAIKFAECHADALNRFKELEAKGKGLGDGTVEQALAEVGRLLRVFFDPVTDNRQRGQAKQSMIFQLKGCVLPVVGKAAAHMASDKFFPLEIVKGTRPYIERVAIQACGAYDLGWHDAAAVMARRLLETLIIELFEAKKLDHKVKNADGTFFYLSGLISALGAETTFNIGRNVTKALPKLKDLGDQSAHSRRYTARQADLDAIRRDFRITIEELVQLTGYK